MMVDAVGHLIWMMSYLLASLVLIGNAAQKESTFWTTAWAVLTLAIAIDIGFTLRILLT